MVGIGAKGGGMDVVGNGIPIAKGWKWSAPQARCMGVCMEGAWVSVAPLQCAESRTVLGLADVGES